ANEPRLVMRNLGLGKVDVHTTQPCAGDCLSLKFSVYFSDEIRKKSVVPLFRILVILLLFFLPRLTFAQDVNEDKTGAWYMYMWNKDLDNSSYGFQGDIQHRNWNLGGDLEQLLIRGGLTWRPQKSSIKYTLGYAYIKSGAFGPNSATTSERRLYQEALIPQRLGSKAYITHRIRLEQRDVDGQDYRNRLRYFVGLNYPLNQDTLGKGAVYLAFYNELFMNFERNIGNDRRVDYFDRNRTYAAIAYSLSNNSRLQFGYMHQETEFFGKGQLQLNLIQNF
ncbi:MAG: DUF2490 domain-containing protein, partial [Pseudomonadales bacterium]|nr:DUF2490 domain-containing protein [Pseudomonadales bacterium]